MMLRRLGAFLFIAAFRFATVQSATAQDEANHIVTIDVKDITELSISDDVTLEFNSANGDNVNEFSGSDIFASASSSTTYEIQTNRDGAELNINLGNMSKFNLDKSDLGLAVVAQTGDETETHEFTDLGVSAIEGGTLDDDFGPLSKTSLDLEYEGVITEDFPENGGEAFTVTYTVTGN